MTWRALKPWLLALLIIGPALLWWAGMPRPW